MPINLQTEGEIIIKTIRLKKAFDSERDLSGLKSDGTGDYAKLVQAMCNNDITDHDLFSTVFLYKKWLKPSTHSFKNIVVRKKLELNYLRSTTSLHTDFTGDGLIGQGIRPQFKTSNLMFNHTMTVVMFRLKDDNSVSIIQQNQSGSSDIKNLELVKIQSVLRNDNDDTIFKISGWFSQTFGCKGVQKNTSVYDYNLNSLNTQVDNLFHANALQGAWGTVAGAGESSDAITLTTQSTTQAAETPNSFNCASSNTALVGYLRVSPPYTVHFTPTDGTSPQLSGVLNTGFDLITFDNGSKWEKS